MNRAELVNAFVTLAHERPSLSPEDFARAFVNEALDVRQSSRSAVTRGVVRVMRRAVRGGAYTHEAVAEVVADWVIDEATS